MYLNTLTRLFRGGLRPVTFTLPSPITLRERRGEIRLLENRLPDTHLLIIPLTHETPDCHGIATLSDRVGGFLNGVRVEIAVRNICVVDDKLHVPFFVLEGCVGTGLMRDIVLVVEIV